MIWSGRHNMVLGMVWRGIAWYMVFTCVEVLWPSQQHVEPVSYPLTLFLGRLRPTKLLTST